MSIIIINKAHRSIHKGPRVYCGRGSPLGNPFVLGKDGNRDQVCDKYAAWFKEQLQVSSYGGNDAFADLLHLITRNARSGDVMLECFCAPRRCHCETIKAYVENVLKHPKKSL